VPGDRFKTWAAPLPESSGRSRLTGRASRSQSLAPFYMEARFPRDSRSRPERCKTSKHPPLNTGHSWRSGESRGDLQLLGRVWILRNLRSHLLLPQSRRRQPYSYRMTAWLLDAWQSEHDHYLLELRQNSDCLFIPFDSTRRGVGPYRWNSMDSLFPVSSTFPQLRIRNSCLEDR
jgi:hypothetical protein